MGIGPYANMKGLCKKVRLCKFAVQPKPSPEGKALVLCGCIKNPAAAFCRGRVPFFDSEADDAQMLQQDLQADEDEDQAAGKLGPGLVPQAEDVADPESCR